MRVILGQYLDQGYYYPLPETKGRMGLAIHGPAGFLGLLETLYGIPRAESSNALRISQYEKILDQLDSPRVFYHQSFKADRFGVAQKLLDSRDEILLSASPDFQMECLLKARSSRIKTIAQLEHRFTADPFIPGIPDRLRELMADIKRAEVVCPIKKIELVEEEGTWEVLWQRMFERLREKGVEFQIFVPEHSRATGNLKKVQDEFSRTTKTRSLDLENEKDPGIVHISCNNLMEAAETTAVITASLLDKKGPRHSLIIQEDESAPLAKALGRQDLPLPNFSTSSLSPAAGQILPLAISLLWDPVNPEVMKEYLELSASPLPESLRGKLLRILSDKPSVYSDDWQEAIRRFKKGGKDKEKIDIWLPTNRKKYQEPQNKEILIELCNHFKAWAHGIAKRDGTTPAFDFALQQAVTLKEMLVLKTDAALTFSEMKSLLKDLAGSHPFHSKSSAEKGAVPSISAPGAILASVGTLVWWLANESTVPKYRKSPLHPDERAELSSFGINLPDFKIRLRAQRLSWIKAVQRANTRIVMVSITQNNGKPDNPHPVWNELLSCFKDSDEAGRLFTRTATDILGHTAPVTCLDQRKISETGFHSFENEHALWHIPKEYLDPRKNESASSLEQFLGCPLKWALNYKAGITEYSAEALPAGPLLWGNLEHEVVGSFFKSLKEEAPDPLLMEGKVRKLFEVLVRKEAAMLLLPSNQKEKLDRYEETIKATRDLMRQMSENDLSFDSNEKEHCLDTEIGPIRGFTDLIFSRVAQKDSLVIVDLKWSGKEKRIKELKRGTAIQLAIYSQIVDRKGSPAAYYILKNTQSLTVDKFCLKDAQKIEGPSLEDTWETIKQSWAYIRRELDQGAVLAGIPEGRELTGSFMIAAPCTYCSYQSICQIKGKEEYAAH